jgi:hypothetical protein
LCVWGVKVRGTADGWCFFGKIGGVAKGDF